MDRKNEITLCEGYARVSLAGKHRGHFLVDLNMIPLIREHMPWYSNTQGFVVYRVKGSNGFKVCLHRLVAGAERQDLVHFLNDDKLDCRRANLWVQKTENRPRGTNPGVHFNSEKQKWRATGFDNGLRKHLGYFDTEAEATAARAEYDSARKFPGVYHANARNKWRAFCGPHYLGQYARKENAIRAVKRCQQSCDHTKLKP